MQPLYTDLLRDIPVLELYEGVPPQAEITAIPDTLIVFDDLMHKVVNNDESLVMFTQYRHHNLSVVRTLGNWVTTYYIPGLTICRTKYSPLFRSSSSRTST